MTGTPIYVSGPGMRARSRRARLTPGRVLRWVIPVLLAIALVAWLVVRSLNASGAESDRYATATATMGDVTETYQGSGTVQKTDQASIGFPSAGTVTSISVTLRQHVEAGQELARMDNTDLRIAVIQAKQALADAEVNLESAENAADGVSTSAASSAPLRAHRRAPQRVEAPPPRPADRRRAPPAVGRGHRRAPAVPLQRSASSAGPSLWRRLGSMA